MGFDDSKWDTFKGTCTIIGGFFISVGIANESNLSFYSVYYASYLRLYNPNITLADVQLLNTIWYFSQLALLYWTPLIINTLGSKLSIFIFGGSIPLILLITSFIEKIWISYLFLGLWYGLSFGALMMLAINVAWTYFPNHPGKCAGTILMGYTISPLIMGNICLYTVNPDNSPATIEVKKDNLVEYYYDESIADNVPFMFRMLALAQGAAILIGFILVQKKKKINVSNQTQLSERLMTPKEKKESTIIFFKSMLTRNYFPVILCGLLAYQFPSFCMSNFNAYGIYLFNDNKFVDLIGNLSMLAAASGKFASGFIFDLTKPKTLYKGALIISMIVCILMSYVSHYKAGYGIMMMTSFFIYGMNVGYFPSISQHVYGADRGTNAYTFIMTALCIASYSGGSGSANILKIFGYKYIFSLYYFFLNGISYLIFSLFDPIKIDAKKLLVNNEKSLKNIDVKLATVVDDATSTKMVDNDSNMEIEKKQESFISMPIIEDLKMQQRLFCNQQKQKSCASSNQFPM